MMGDKMTVAEWNGDDTPKGEGPHKLIIGNKCIQKLPQQMTYYDYSKYVFDPDQQKKGIEEFPGYLKKVLKKQNGFIDAMKPAANGKKIEIAGFQCDGYTAKYKDYEPVELYFSKDPKLLGLVKAIGKNVKSLPKEIALSVFRAHPKYGVLMKSGMIPEMEDLDVQKGLINWGSEFEVIIAEELELDDETFSLVGYTEVPGEM